MRKKLDLVNQRAVSADAAAEAMPPADDVLEALHAVVHLVRARQHQGVRGAGPEVTPLEGRVLGFFARHPGATQRELAEHSGRDKGQLARLVNGLRERGLLAAQADADDRRVTRLTLTALAQQQHQAVVRQRRRLLQAAAAGLSEAERATLVALLGRMRRNLEALP